MIEMGSTAKDRITGFRGIVTGRAQYLTGCNQYLLNPPAKDGALVCSEWFDEQRLEVDASYDVVRLDNSNGNGADRAAPKR